MILSKPRRYWIGLQGEVLGNVSALIRGAKGNKYWHVILFFTLLYLFLPSPSLSFFFYSSQRKGICIARDENGFKWNIFQPPPPHIHTLVIPFFLSLTWRVSFLLFENTVPFPPRQITISESRKRERKSRSWGGGLNEMKIRGHLFHLDSFFTLHLGPVFIFAQAEDGCWSKEVF